MPQIAPPSSAFGKTWCPVPSTGPSTKPAPGVEILSDADAILVSAISVYETARKVRIGKWPEAAHLLDAMPARIGRDGTAEAPLTADICLRAGSMDWPHRAPFDRILAATAALRNLTLVTMDPVFASLPAIRTIWRIQQTSAIFLNIAVSPGHLWRQRGYVREPGRG
ncbi:type II toxin-antitoxin system VapC family toxin [Roseivivax sp. CAU 1753]